MISFEQKTSKEICVDIAHNIVAIRKRRKISQKELSIKAKVSLGSLRRFEQSGEISLSSLAKIAIVLDLEEELDGLFKQVPYLSIEEVINEQNK